MVGNVQTGTIKWSIADNDGKVSRFLIPNSYYAKAGGVRLLSPQHFAKQINDHKPNKYGTYVEVYDDKAEMYWNQRRQRLTIPVDPITNVFNIYSAPDYDSYEAYCAQVGDDDEDDNDIICMDVEAAYGKEPEEPPDHEELAHSLAEPSEVQWPAPNKDAATRKEAGAVDTDFDWDGPNKTTGALDSGRTSGTEDALADTQEEEKQPKPNKVEAEFLHWHVQLNHISPASLQRMAKVGILPKRLATCEVPMCKACMYGKAKRLPRKTTAEYSPIKTTVVRNPGDCVSVDQLESRTPGLVAVIKGIPSKQRYTAATIFVDHVSRLGYVHLQKVIIHRSGR